MNILDKSILIVNHCFLILSLYLVFYIFLSLNDKFNKLKYEKKLYVIKNFIKSYILCYMTYTTFHILLQILYELPFNNLEIYHYSSLYVCNDLIALIVVPKLPFTTKIHHCITTCLLFYSLSIDYNSNNIGKLILIYTFFSCYSFIVNFYLGLRYFYTIITKQKRINNHEIVVNNFIDTIRISAYYNYLLCCAINWSIHIIIFIYRLYNNIFDRYHILYIIIFRFVVKDDLILLNWLYNKNIDL